MVLLLEIPEYLYYILFAVVASFIVYAIEPSQINYTSAPISNFTNINKTILYTVDKPDNITVAIYKYGSIENTSKKLNQSINQVLKSLAHSQTFFLNCTLMKEEKFGDPIISKQICTIFGKQYEYNP